MEALFSYLLKVSVVSGLFYIVYKLFLSNTTFYYTNRLILNGIILISLSLPFVHIQTRSFVSPEFSIISSNPASVSPEIVSENSAGSTTSLVNEASRSTSNFSWSVFLVVGYYAGLLFFVLRLLIGFLQMKKLIGLSEQQLLDDNSILCLTDKVVAPFSWNRYIVLTTIGLSSDSDYIIRHEKAHLQLYHSVDLLIVNVFSAVVWFNPFAWLLRRELQLVHEHQADERVVSHDSTRADSYQKLLIRRSVGEYKFELAHNFENNNLKRRIRMMTKKRSGVLHQWLYGTLVFALLACLFSVSCTQPTKTTKEAITGHVTGSFTNDSMNGTLVLHTNTMTPDTLKNSAGKIIRIDLPGDSIIAEHKVENGNFSFDYSFATQHRVKLTFIDSDDNHWQLDFVNPFVQSDVRYLSNYCYFDPNASVSIKVLDEKKYVRNIESRVSTTQPNASVGKAKTGEQAAIEKLKVINESYSDMNIIRRMSAQVSGSASTDQLFKQQLSRSKRSEIADAKR